MIAVDMEVRAAVADAAVIDLFYCNRGRKILRWWVAL
jgi:hypothetical protein